MSDLHCDGDLSTSRWLGAGQGSGADRGATPSPLTVRPGAGAVEVVALCLTCHRRAAQAKAYVCAWGPAGPAHAFAWRPRGPLTRGTRHTRSGWPACWRRCPRRRPRTRSGSWWPTHMLRRTPHPHVVAPHQAGENGQSSYAPGGGMWI